MHFSRREFLQGIVATASAAGVSRSLLSAAFPQSAKSAQVSRQVLAADPLRPQFHLLPARNWMNDPNAPMYWKGQYHMFFQYNPGAAVWGDMHWAHAVSADMIHWKHLPVALAPTPGSYDQDGCFTGSGVDDHGTATILYTGVAATSAENATLRDGVHNFREVQCLATSSDPMLNSWNKLPAPVLQPPKESRLTGFRDPFLWRDAATWYLGVGSGLQKEGGRVLLYRSKDLRQWEYLHELCSGKWTGKESINPVDSGEMWECPDFFALGKKHVLLYSTAGKVYWETGELDPKELRFHMRNQGVLDHGAYYAQKTQLDATGNRILWGWIPETRPEAEFSAAGWAGCMALPRVLSIGGNGELEMRVAPVAQPLRAKPLIPAESHSSPAKLEAALKNLRIENLAGEFAWSTKIAPSTFTLADNSGPWWSAKIEPQGENAKVTINEKSFEIPAAGQAALDFHLFLDASVAELICNGKHAITARIYRKPSGPLRLSVSDSYLAQLEGLQAWQLRTISPDRLTT